MTSQHNFKPGDRVRRIGDSWGGVKPGDINVVKVVGSASILLEGKASTGYDPSRFELVEAATPEPETTPTTPKWTLTVEIQAEDLATAIDVAAALPMNFAPDVMPDEVLEYHLKGLTADGKYRGVSFTR